MALAAVNITIGQSLGGGRYSSSIKGGSAPDFATVTTDMATAAADVATLVADGASPTQGHVTTLDTDFSAANAAYTALAGTINGDVTVVWDSSTITSRNQMRAALAAALSAIDGGYGGLAE